ncbi:MAG: tRNA glutamyl-Q(34) synthetase GluQRS [Geminicoccaceae bacterium]|nr:MAG: tRNA glutamyl-Q(34) synthetase GluQRS [Geminicoccaceae bacterium]
MLTGEDVVPVPAAGEAPFVTRFAPSPTGLLHLGHAYSALFAHETAKACGGRFLLRIEDIDHTRCRPEFEKATLDDLRWLGLRWEAPAWRQSPRTDVYQDALGKLKAMGVVYPCFCTRAAIRHEIAESARAPHGPSGEPVYPGTCRGLDPVEGRTRIARGMPHGWRLDVEAALAHTGALAWYDVRAGWQDCRAAEFGDVVLARKDIPTSYHLAVTVDDAAQGVTLVTRGEDLFHATHIHRLLQALLGLPTPTYYHHNLIATADGQRLAKRNRSVSLKYFRERGETPASIWRQLGLGVPATAEG